MPLLLGLMSESTICEEAEEYSDELGQDDDEVDPLFTSAAECFTTIARVYKDVAWAAASSALNLNSDEASTGRVHASLLALGASSVSC